VPPLSGLWCADDITAFVEGRKHEWKWTLMILMPDRVTREVFEEGKKKLEEKKNPPFLDLANFEIYEEGLSAQIMHMGPYAEEGPTIAKLHDFFQDIGYTFNGRHHEIYLSDPRRCKPEKMRTILRQPIYGICIFVWLLKLKNSILGVYHEEKNFQQAFGFEKENHCPPEQQ
jgi:hypothetical protein